MTPNNPLVLAPIFFPLSAAAICVLFARYTRIQHMIGVAATILAAFASFAILVLNWDEGLQIYRLGGWNPPYGIVLAPDMLSAIFTLMAAIVIAGGAVYILGCHDKCVTYPAFMPLYLCMAAGLNGAFYTGDIFTLFVFQELMIMSSVVLVAISDNKFGVEAAIKYLLISAMGSLFLLLGIGAIYASFGTLTLADIARLLESGERPLLAQAAAIMLMCAFLLKSAVFPFHFWQPDFHTTAPTPISAALSSVVVKVGVYGLIRLTMLLFIAEAPLVRNLLLILGIVGIFFGSLAALRTYDAKRMLAYSTFGQVGFILLGIGWGTPLALVGAIVYTVNHAFIKSSLLLLIGALASRMQVKTARLSEIGGAGRKLPLMGALFLLGGLALAGVPPLNGFISKLSIINGGIAAESWLILGLAVAAGLITFLYIARTWQHVFQQQPKEEIHLKSYGDSLVAPFLLVSLCVLLGLYAVPVVSAAMVAVDRLSDPQIYIRAVLGG